MEALTTSAALKIATAGLKLLKPIGKIFGKHIDENYFLYKRLYPILAKSNSFDRVYSSTIKALEKMNVIEEIMTLFSSYGVRESFKHAYDKKSRKDEIVAAANAEIAVNKKLAILTERVEPEVDRFIDLFIKQANAQRSPVEILAQGRTEEGFKEVKNELRDTFHATRDYLDLSNQIQNFSNLRNEGQHKSVLRLLEDYKTKNWKSLSQIDRRKLQINLGVTYFEIEDYEKASEYLIDSMNYGEDADAYSFVALGYAIIEDTINAKYYAEKAIQLYPNTVNAYSVLLAAEKGTFTKEKMEGIIPEKIREQPLFAMTYGARLEQINQFDEAIYLYEKALLSLKEKDMHYYEIVYHLGLAKFRSLLIKDESVFDQLSDERNSQLKDILKLYDVSWNYFKETDLRKSKWYILANKAAVQKVVKDYKGAE